MECRCAGRCWRPLSLHVHFGASGRACPGHREIFPPAITRRRRGGGAAGAAPEQSATGPWWRKVTYPWCNRSKIRWESPQLPLVDTCVDNSVVERRRILWNTRGDSSYGFRRQVCGYVRRCATTTRRRSRRCIKPDSPQLQISDEDADNLVVAHRPTPCEVSNGAHANAASFAVFAEFSAEHEVGE